MDIVSTPKSIGIDFDSNEIRFVEGKASKKGIIINKHFSIEIPSGIYEDGVIRDRDKLSFIMSDALSANGISKGRKVHAVINSSIIIIREVAFPKVPKEDIDNLIEYQLGDFVPIHPEDYVVKYINLGSFLEDGVEKLNMLIIGVPKEMVEDHLNLIKDLGLRPMVLDYKGNASTKLISFGQELNDQVVGGKTIGFLDLSFDSTSFTILKDDLIEVSRLVEGGLNNIIEDISSVHALSEDEALQEIMNIDDLDEETLDMDSMLFQARGSIKELADRVDMLVRYYHTRDMDNNIDLFVLHGPLTKVKGIDKFLAKQFNIQCVRLESVGKLKFDGDLSKYGNAIGGLIRVSGV